MNRSWGAVKKGLMELGSFLGKIWTAVLLSLFYCTVFALIAVAQKISGTDLLRRRKTASTWQPFEHVGRQEDWFKMY